VAPMVSAIETDWLRFRIRANMLASSIVTAAVGIDVVSEFPVCGLPRACRTCVRVVRFGNHQW
jgi:hypothetical protein